jgi:glycosyltransferase involved in cell wall biosynthesis
VVTLAQRDDISVVITTFQRPDLCERALASVLEQSVLPLEVLVCDNGSRDDTEERFRAWQERCGLVRYLRAPLNSGTPATTRNLGIDQARGEWIAFLDDDDVWLPEKLSRQLSVIGETTADVIATNALRRSGGLYFAGAPELLEPTRRDLLAANPVITSSAIVRRSVAHFPTDAWLSGIEDYAAWLEVNDAGGRIVVLGEPLVLYEDSEPVRLSSSNTRRRSALARLAWQRAVRRPFDGDRIRFAINATLGMVRGFTSH